MNDQAKKTEPKTEPKPPKTRKTARRSRGRPAKLTPAVSSTICDAIRRGASLRISAMAAGVSYDSLSRWRNDGMAARARINGEAVPDDVTFDWPIDDPPAEVAARIRFANDLELASADAALAWLDAIDRATSYSWQAAAWKLERRFPTEFGRDVQSVEHTGDLVIRIQNETGDAPPAALDADRVARQQLERDYPDADDADGDAAGSLERLPFDDDPDDDSDGADDPDDDSFPDDPAGDDNNAGGRPIGSGVTLSRF